MSLNEGRDEVSGVQVGPKIRKMSGEYLDYAEVRKNLDEILDWLSGLYVNTMNVIHYMHDKYYYERLQMALHETEVHRFMAFGLQASLFLQTRFRL